MLETPFRCLRAVLLVALCCVAIAAEPPVPVPPLPDSAWIGVVVAEEPRGGVRVVLAIEDGPAQLAGLRVGDVILRIDDRPVRDADGFRALLRSRRPGEQLPILVRRGSADRQLAVLTAGRPVARPPRVTAPVAQLPAAPNPRSAPRSLTIARVSGAPGVGFRALTPELRGHFGAPTGEGVLVTRVDREQLGARLGLQVGDVLVRIGGEPVTDPARALARLIVPSRELTVKVVRSRKMLDLTATATAPEPQGSWPGQLAEADRARQRAQLQREIERLQSRLEVLRARLARLEPE